MISVLSPRRAVMTLTALTLLLAGPAFAQAPIKVGVLFPLGGVLGVMGNGSGNAVKLAFEEEGNMIAGRPVQVLVEDDEAKVDVSLAKLRKLVELENVNPWERRFSVAICRKPKTDVHQLWPRIRRWGVG